MVHRKREGTKGSFDKELLHLEEEQAKTKLIVRGTGEGQCPLQVDFDADED